MSIKTRVEDAEHLWAQGRKEGAWVQALIAVAATARKRYPRPMGDRKAFTSFVADISHTILTGEIGGPGPVYLRFYTEDRADHRTLEDMLYAELRCNLVHEAELKEIGFSESRAVDGKLVGALSVPTRGRGVIPAFWVLHLIAAVKAAPENSDLFGDGARGM